MGNRAVLCLKDNDNGKFDKKAVGIYLHWHGSEGQIAYFLEGARKIMDDRMGDYQYAKARLIEFITREVEGNLSVGIGITGEMDYDNFDNGTYIINCSKLTVTGREYAPGE
jgi:hypothetical protein